MIEVSSANLKVFLKEYMEEYNIRFKTHAYANISKEIKGNERTVQRWFSFKCSQSRDMSFAVWRLINIIFLDKDVMWEEERDILF